jgi:hypothetical protein
VGLARQTSADPQPLDPGAYCRATQSVGAVAHIRNFSTRGPNAPVWPLEMGSPAATSRASRAGKAPAPLERATTVAHGQVTPAPVQQCAADHQLAMEMQAKEDRRPHHLGTCGEVLSCHQVKEVAAAVRTGTKACHPLLDPEDMLGKGGQVPAHLPRRRTSSASATG